MAVVTGGNGGIGLGIARALARAGASIVVAARNETKTDSAVGELQQLSPGDVLGIRTNVADEASVGEMVQTASERFGRIDILVNNAGINVRKQPHDLTADEWRLVVDVNLNGAFLCAKAVRPYMGGGGKIINIGSMLSIFGSDWALAYSSSKGGIVQLSKSLAVAWARDNIQVNAILPGWIHTDLTAPIKTDFPDRYSTITSRIPHGRWGEPDELGGTAVFLASRASDYVTGAVISVDGGYSVT